MLYRGAMGAMAIAGMLGVATCEAWAFDDARYPDLKGQWIGVRARPEMSSSNSQKSRPITGTETL